jgi:DNA-binding CsgD family transcriptional regulator
LTHRTTKQVFEFLRKLYVLRSWNDLTTHLVGAIPSLIPTDICSYNEMNSRRRHAAYRMWPPDRSMIPDAPEILGTYSYQHPLVTHIEHTKDLSARKITDFVTQRQFRTTELYNELYKPLQIPYCMGAGLAVNKDCLIAIGLNRGGRDFTEDELVVLDLLRPHVVQAFGNAEAVTRMREELSTLNQAMEELRRGLVSVTHKGRILWATTEAHRLLETYGLRDGRRSVWLPSLLREWTNRELKRMDRPTDFPAPFKPLVIEREESTLTIRLLNDGQNILLSLEESRAGCAAEDLAPLGLSPRETEILSWVVNGKTNPEIGTILGISPRTVQKHLERIYGALGVENRHAAIVAAMTAARRSFGTAGRPPA